ncbi:hypothetical protein OJAV_G00137430 [Oryzias javanicus]|uniref:Fasciculation and elongation protein zeta-1 n=1 Tax=Oryzias javanicus TaxID=123683 RepID=A0A3S2P062_ORYJA|nr:hypothetical protein OJAV_G00137430 [Oryzias javanicus]
MGTLVKPGQREKERVQRRKRTGREASLRNSTSSIAGLPEQPDGDTMEAPLVCLDEEFEDLRPCRMEDLDNPALSHASFSTTTVPLASITREDFSELENFSEMMSFKSMEDLVNEFDEKLNVCFHNYNTKTEGLAPIRSQSHNQEDEERLQDEDVWDALTDNYISTWDATNSEGLNGNLSDREICEKDEEENDERERNTPTA